MSRKPGVVTALVVASAVFLHGQRKPPPQKPPPPPPPIAPLVVAQLLDTYAAGRFDEAVREVTQVDLELAVNLRQHWRLDAQPWIDAVPEQRNRRLLVAASLVLEIENATVERGAWGTNNGEPFCNGACALDWAQAALVQRTAPDAAERAWYLATAALAGGVRDWRYLQRALPPTAPPGVLPGLTERALARFPGDPQLRLEQALASAGRFNTTVDGGRLTNDPSGLSITMMGPPRGLGPAATPTLPPRELAMQLLTALVPDAVVGPEAAMRLGYLQWVLGDDTSALRSLRNAAERAAAGSDLRYLSRFLLGWVAMQAGDAAAAIPELKAALVARPDSQSAALALATLELQRGEASTAYDTARASIDHRNTDDDPWRLFLYGHHPQLAARIAALRAEVRR